MTGKKENKLRIVSNAVKKASKKLERRPAEAPKTTKDMVLTLAEAIRFAYSETLGKWHLFDVPRAIIYDMFDKNKKTVAAEIGERSDCVQVKEPDEILKELYELRTSLTQTKLFSKKRFRAFLFAAEFSQEDVLLRKRRARILKPAFTIILDTKSECLLVFIRGTRSIKDTLTDAIGAPVTFNHFINTDGKLKKDNTVSGYAHRGMVASAGWIKKHCTPILLDALLKHPDFKIKIVGHSLGGGTAALLTYMLREIKQFSSATCVTFGPAACMSLELAEFGKSFITSVINDSDIVPTLSASSVHDFISEGRIKRRKFLNAARSSITAVGSRLPLVSSAKAIANFAVTRGSQVVMKEKQRTHSLLPAWSRREKINTLSSSKSDNLAEVSQSSEHTDETFLTEEIIIGSTTDDDDSNASSEGLDNDDIDEKEQFVSACDQNIADTCDDELLNELKELEFEKQDNAPNIHAIEKEVAASKDITEEENEIVQTSNITSDKLENHCLYPPGKIMHIITVPLSENSKSNSDDLDERQVYLYKTPRVLYGKLRISKRMLSDHLTDTYLNMLRRLINQLEKEKNNK